MTERYALIPVKDLDGAKTRVADVLDAAARRDLVVAMYRDVLAAAIACAVIERVTVVSSDADVLSMAAAQGTEPMQEPGGLNDSLTSASRKLAARGVDRLLILFADVPLANAEAIERVVCADADVALVPSSDGGTNALALSPGAIAFQFGPDSAARHTASAERAGLRVLRLDVAALALDIDTPDDFERLQQIAASGKRVGEHTLAALRRIGVSTAAERPA
jgi:2-phospho-L-lactate guanylyltransferase